MTRDKLGSLRGGEAETGSVLRRGSDHLVIKPDTEIASLDFNQRQLMTVELNYRVK